MKLRYIEILDEEIYDLLQPGGGYPYTKNQVKLHEWEGAQIQGIRWVHVASSSQLLEFYRGGSENKTNRVNEFGNMSEKATQLFQIEII